MLSRPTELRHLGGARTILKSTLALLMSWHQLVFRKHQHLQSRNAAQHPSPRQNGVLQSQTVDCCRSRPVQPLQQSVCAIDQKWQGPENRERVVPATRHSLLVKSLQSMPRDCAARLLKERFDHQTTHVKSKTNPFQSHPSFCPIRQQDPRTSQMANILSRIRTLFSLEWTCSKSRPPSMMLLCSKPYLRRLRTARYHYTIAWYP
jgi:hypothetical protein